MTKAKQGTVVIINGHDALISFLMEILEIDDSLESESELYKNNSFRILYELLKEIHCFTAVIEFKYVERVYRDSYYMYYSCKHIQYDRYCKRIFLFHGDIIKNMDSSMEFPDLDKEMLQEEFIGTIAIRPLKESKIGRSLINPYYFTNRNNVYLRYAKYSVTIFGLRLYVNAFPYSMQDGETTTCAEITILNLLDYFSMKYPEYKYILPSEIAAITTRNGFERSLPSKGLAYSVITKVFSEVGFYPRLYKVESLMEMSQFKRIMHYYIESGIPVAVGVKVEDKARHSIICIGHGKIRYENLQKKIYAIYNDIVDDYIWLVDTADFTNDYVVMDDGQSPYVNYEWKTMKEDKAFAPDKYQFGKYEPDALMVPLYRRMFLEAQDAYDICTSVLASSELGIRNFQPELGTKTNPVVIRLFMASSRGFKKNRIYGFTPVNKEVRERYINVLIPRFVWVCELYTVDGYQKNKAIGEIVLDATASPYDITRSILILHYPYQIMCRNMDPQEESNKNRNLQIIDRLYSWEEFRGYSNLYSPSKN